MKVEPDMVALLASTQDEETAGFIALAKREALPRLVAARWVPRWEGIDGLGCLDYPRRGLRLIHSIARELDGEVWAHVSVSRRDRVLPTWEQTRDVFRILYDQLAGVVVIPPADKHVNIGEVSHIWACLTRPAVPDFTHGTGSI